MNENTITKLFTIFLILAVLTILPVGVIYWDTITWFFSWVFTILLIMGGVTIGYGFIWLTMIVWTDRQEKIIDNQIKREEANKLKAENEVLKSQALAGRVVDSQFGPILAYDSNNYEMMVGRLLNQPQAIPLIHGYAPKAIPPNIIVEEESDRPKSVLEVCQRWGNLHFYGDPGSGKSANFRWLIQTRASMGYVALLDTNSPSHVLNFDVIGSGDDFNAIKQALRDFVKLGKQRLQDWHNEIVKDAKDFPKITILIDELNNLVKQDKSGEIAENLQIIITKYRAIQISVCIASQTDRVASVGFKGAGDILESFTKLEFTGFEGLHHKAFLVEGKSRNDRYELDLPPYLERPNVTEDQLYYPDAIEGDYQLLPESPAMDLSLREKVKIAYESGFIRPYDIAKHIGCGTGGRQLDLIRKYLLEINPKLAEVI